MTRHELGAASHKSPPVRAIPFLRHRVTTPTIMAREYVNRRIDAIRRHLVVSSPNAPAGSSLFGGDVAIITGAGRGIGREAAILLAKNGARLVLNDLDRWALDETRAFAPTTSTETDSVRDHPPHTHDTGTCAKMRAGRSRVWEARPWASTATSPSRRSSRSSLIGRSKRSEPSTSS